MRRVENFHKNLARKPAGGLTAGFCISLHIAGCATALPTLTDMWRNLHDALDDIPALAAEITRLSAELERTQLDRANLQAAIRATLAAHADGEPDPMWYLRDELNAPETATRRRL